MAGWSEAHYVDLMPHNPLGPICTAATIHFSAAVANFFALETRASPAENYMGCLRHLDLYRSNRGSTARPIR